MQKSPLFRFYLKLYRATEVEVFTLVIKRRALAIFEYLNISILTNKINYKQR